MSNPPPADPAGGNNPAAPAEPTAATKSAATQPSGLPASAAPAPVSPSGEPTPWTGDPGFPIADNWMLVDPRYVRKGIPRWLHSMLLAAMILFMAYLLFLYFFHTPGADGFRTHPPTGLHPAPTAQPAPAPPVLPLAPAPPQP